MEFLNNLAAKIIALPRKTFRIYIGIALGCIVLASGGLVYILHAQRSSALEKLKKLAEYKRKNDRIVLNFEKIKAEEERIQTLLENNKGFNIKSYFEQFCSEHGVTPEAGWNTEVRSIDGNEQFDEIVLPASFSNQTTKSMVEILNSLDANEIVYIKELDIRQEEAHKISFNVTIATKKQKRFWHED